MSPSSSQDASRHRLVLSKARATAGWPIMASMAVGLGLGVFAYWTTSSERELEDALLRAVVREVEKNYVEEVPRARLVDEAIGGMLASLDGHSGLLDERALTILQDEADGGFGGIGVRLGMVDGQLTVVETLPDTPAERAGILADDQLLQVDHQPVRQVSDAARVLRGRRDTPVHVRVRRDAPAAAATSTASHPASAGAGQFDFDLTRALIPLPTVYELPMVPGYGYVRIAQFQEQTVEELAEALVTLAAERPLEGLVMDLRDNPGGLLGTSIDVADAFLASGVIVSVAGRGEGETREFTADADVLAEDVALAVLVNQTSASGAEIVAAALQHHGRAVVLGTKTYGKASVQTITHFPGVSRIARRALKLTTARYLTPAGRSLDKVGVVPDITVPPDDDEPDVDYDERLIREALVHFGVMPKSG